MYYNQPRSLSLIYTASYIFSLFAASVLQIDNFVGVKLVVVRLTLKIHRRREDVVIPHGSGVLRARALRRRWLVAHALVPIRGLRHLTTRGQLAPRQLAATRAQAAALEPATGPAQVAVLHAEAHLAPLHHELAGRPAPCAPPAYTTDAKPHADIIG